MAPAAAPAAVDEVDDGNKSEFSWVHVVRKVVACAVVLLIVAVSVYAVVVVLRPGELDVFVVGGSLSLSTSNSTSQVQRLFLKIALDNHGGRGTIYYTGVTAKLEERNTLSAAPANTIMNLTLGDIIVKKQSMHTISRFPLLDKRTTTSYGEMFFRNHTEIAGAEADLILNGNLTTNLYALHNRTATPTTYTCRNVTVGVSSDEDGDDVECEKSAAAGTAAKLWLNCSVFLVTSLFLVISTSLTSGGG